MPRSAVPAVTRRGVDAYDPRARLPLVFFSPPTGKRGSLICLRAGVFVNERARSVDPKRGRCSEKGAELTREGLARAFVRSLGVV